MYTKMKKLAFEIFYVLCRSLYLKIFVSMPFTHESWWHQRLLHTIFPVTLLWKWFPTQKGGWIQRQHYSGIVVREENLKFSGLTKEEETQWGGGGLVAFSGVEH